MNRYIVTIRQGGKIVYLVCYNDLARYHIKTLLESFRGNLNQREYTISIEYESETGERVDLIGIEREV
jgi:hypothetical protein